MYKICASKHAAFSTPTQSYIHCTYMYTMIHVQGTCRSEACKIPLKALVRLCMQFHLLPWLQGPRVHLVCGYNIQQSAQLITMIP